MKQRKLLKFFALLVCMIMGAGTAWAEETLLASFPGENTTGYSCTGTTSTCGSSSDYVLKNQTIYAIDKDNSITFSVPENV